MVIWQAQLGEQLHEDEDSTEAQDMKHSVIEQVQQELQVEKDTGTSVEAQTPRYAYLLYLFDTQVSIGHCADTSLLQLVLVHSCT